MLAFVKMIFRVRLYGVSRHEDGAKRNPNGQCGGEELGGTANRGLVLRASKNVILELNIAIFGYKEIFFEDEFNKDVLA